ncbi:MAG TPA: flagellin [Methylomirabilota bacterium]|nr:flagellin [Methylomirabilota bacterium]
MVINTNTTAQNAASNLQSSQAMLNKSLARLSSGSKIVNPSDDAAGLAVSTRLDAQIGRINAARSNVNNAISFTQAQDGYLMKIGKALSRMGELAILAQDVTKTDADRELYNAEYAELAEYVADAATKTFNGVPLFANTGLDITTDGDGASFTMNGIDLGAAVYTDALGSGVGTVEDAQEATTLIQDAMTQLSEDRAQIGSYQTRLTHSGDQLAVSKENLLAASSRIKDVDVAEESTEFARTNILVQSGTAMLAQANQIPQNILKLLQ